MMISEEALAALLYGGNASGFSFDPDEVAEAAASVRRMVLQRTHRGSGSLGDWFPQTVAAWGDDLEKLTREFCRSPFCASWRELSGSISIEEAWFRFFENEGIGDAATREDELLGAVVRGLAVTPRARFTWPGAVKPAPGGCFALTQKPILHAALDGRYLRGEVTPIIAAILAGEPIGDEQVRMKLRSMRLLY